MAKTLLHTTIQLMQQSAADIADVEVLQQALDKLRADLAPPVLEVTESGQLRRKAASPYTELLRKRKWTPADIRQALALFAGKLPNTMVKALLTN